MPLGILILTPCSQTLLDVLNTEGTRVDQIWFSLPGNTDAAHLSFSLGNTSQGLFIYVVGDSWTSTGILLCRRWDFHSSNCATSLDGHQEKSLSVSGDRYFCQAGAVPGSVFQTKNRQLSWVFLTWGDTGAVALAQRQWLCKCLTHLLVEETVLKYSLCSRH